MTDAGRNTTCQVSAYTRTRVHQSRVIAGEKRVLTANLNGAIGVGRTITQARWRCEYGLVAGMANAAIATDKRSTSVDLAALWIGTSMIQCEATLDNGEVYVQMFEIDVSGNPWFLPTASVSVPTELIATA